MNTLNTQRKNHLVEFLKIWGPAVLYYFLLVNTSFLTCEAVYIDNHKLSSVSRSNSEKETDLLLGTNSVVGEKIFLLDDIKHFDIDQSETHDTLPNNHKYKFIFHFKVKDISPTKEFAICIRYQNVKKIIKKKTVFHILQTL